MSILQWSVNPYPGSVAVISPLLRLTSAAQAVTADVQNGGQAVSQVQRRGASFTLPVDPAYYVALQYSSTHAFNFSAIRSNKTATMRGSSNFTLPACSVYNGVAYVPCKSCNIFSYTDFNVTFSCFDITQVCPSTLVQRYLRDEGQGSSGASIVGGDGDGDSGTGEDVDSHGRFLSLDDDRSVSPVSSLSYGVVMQSIEAEFHDVLSSNPFTLSLEHSTVVLIFMGSLSGFIIIMIFYLLKKDRNEKLYKTLCEK